MKLEWDKTSERYYETGVNKGVLYIPNQVGAYVNGVAWNGLTTVTESPSGAEATAQYADNIKYLNLVSAEEFGGTIEAFTYPDEFAQFDGIASPTPGVNVGQQSRKTFGLSYVTQVGNDTDGSDFGFKTHLVYGAQAAPSEKAYATINDSPEAISFSWEFTTSPVSVPGYKPSAIITIDSRKVNADSLAALAELLYGTPGTDPSLPLPVAVFALFTGTVLEAVPSSPTFSTPVITIPSVTGVDYKIDGAIVVGTVTITKDTVVTASPQAGYKFPLVTDDDWLFKL